MDQEEGISGFKKSSWIIKVSSFTLVGLRRYFLIGGSMVLKHSIGYIPILTFIIPISAFEDNGSTRPQRAIRTQIY